MALKQLPPSASCSCDKCGRNLGWGGGDYDYMVFDLAEWPGILREHGWMLDAEMVWCEDCLYERALNAMTRECDYCDGRGWYGEPDHGPDCTPDKCGAPCPVERQVPCPSCAGSGRRL